MGDLTEYRNALPVKIAGVDANGNETGALADLTSRSELRVAEAIRLIGEHNTDSILDNNIWTQTLVGSGTVTIGNALARVRTGTTANSSALFQSLKRARFITGTVNAYYAGVKLGDTGTANNVKRWGAYDATDGVFFQLNGSTFGIGIRQTSSDTIVTSFNGATPTVDTNFHTYEIRYTQGTALFFQDNILIHSYTSTTTALSDTPHHKLSAECINSGGSTSDLSLYIRGSAILRYGAENCMPIAYRSIYSQSQGTGRVQAVTAHSSGSVASLSVTLSSTTAGNFIALWVGRRTTATTLTISDNQSQSYTEAFHINDSSNGTVTLYYVPNTKSGVTTITVTPSANDYLAMIAAEYPNVALSSPLDRTTTTTNGNVSGNWSSGATAATNQASELLLGVAMDVTFNETMAAGTGWTLTGSVGQTDIHFQLFGEDQVVSTTGTFSATGTDNGGGAIVLVGIATFKLSTVLPPILTANSPTVLKYGPGRLRRITINSLGTGSAAVGIYDCTTGTTSQLANLSLTSAIGHVDYNLNFDNGLTLQVNSTTADFTVIYD